MLPKSLPASGERWTDPPAPDDSADSAAAAPAPLDPLASSTPLELPAVALSPLVPMLSPVPVAPPVEPIPSQRGLSLLLPLVPVASSGPDEALLPLEEPLDVTVPSLCPDTPGVCAPPALPVDRVGALPEVDPEVPELITARSLPRGSADCIWESSEDASDGALEVVSGVREAASSEADWLCAIETGAAVIKDKRTAKGNLFMLAPDKWNAGCDRIYPGPILCGYDVATVHFMCNAALPVASQGYSLVIM